LIAVVCGPRTALAGGLYLMPRGVGPGSQAGAVTASVQGVHSLWYNPAGLASGSREVLFDLTLPFVRAGFTRLTERSDGSFSRSPAAEASSTPIPIPTLGYTDSFGLKRFGFGIALLVPPGYSLDWPSSVNGERAPQRYSILDTHGSAIGTLALGAGYRPLDWLSLGAALYITAAQVGGTVAVSACDYVVCQIPEGREWEGRTRFLLGPVYTASANFGAQGDFGRIKVGISGQLRTTLSGDAKFDVTLPDQKFFDGVTVENGHGSKDVRAHMKAVLPGIARIGVQGKATDDLTIELDGTWERWSVQDSLRINPKDVFVRNIPTIGSVRAQPVSLARNMKDTYAVQLGGQYDLSKFVHRRLFANAGLMFETSAFADKDLSPTTIDTNKFLTALGLSVQVAHNLLLDVSYGHVFMQNREVRDSRVLLPSAIRPTPADRPAIGNGNYRIEADFVGLGLRWLLDGAASTTPTAAKARPRFGAAS
jgi:long-subunit fatty acid transport protein